MLEHISTRVLVTDSEGQIVKDNHSNHEGNYQLAGQNLFTIFKPSLSELHIARLRAGKSVWCKIGKLPFQVNHGKFLLRIKPLLRGPEPTGYLAELIEVDELENENHSLRNALTQKKLLLQEVHHRVKNNMQVVHSALSICSRQIQDVEGIESVLNILRMVESMILVHEALQEANMSETHLFSYYLQSLTERIKEAYSLERDQVKFTVNCPELEFSSSNALYLIMVVNELLTNIFKHSFPEGRHGEISLKGIVGSDPASFYLIVTNNGQSFPRHFNPSNGKSFGMRLVRLMLAQLGGELILRSEDLNSVTVKVPLPNRRCG